MGNDRSTTLYGANSKTRYFTSHWKSYAFISVFLIFVSSLNHLLLPFLGYRANGFIFLVCVLPVSVIYGLGPALFFATGSAMVWDYFFIPPKFTIAIQASEDVMMNLTYFVIAIVSGLLGTRIRKQEVLLKQREQEAKLLYDLETHLANQNSVDSTLKEATQFLWRHLHLNAHIIEGNGIDLVLSDEILKTNLSKDEGEHARWVYRNEKRAGLGTQTFPSARFSYFPLRGNEGPAGVLYFDSDKQSSSIPEKLLRQICTNIGIAIERQRHRATAERNALLEKSEKLHQTLLNSVSHEFRTPLTTLLGTLDRLFESENSSAKADFVGEIKSSAEKLNQIVTNLLDMSRVTSGALQLNKNIIDLNDFVHTCINRSSRLLRSHSVVICESPQPAYILGDEKVLETALINLLGNSVSYSPVGTEIRIAISLEGTNTVLEVADSGPGISSGHEEKIFEHFYTSQGGIGLGLAIVRAIVEAHSGSVYAKTRTGGGAAFVILLPHQILPASLNEELQSV